ncbi:NADH oxidase [compost metagenome]
MSQGKVNDYTHKWRGGESDAALIFATLSAAPLDFLHTTEFEAWQPAFADAPSLAALARRHGKLPVIANGALHAPHAAAGMLARGEADLVALGRGALAHADWPQRVRAGQALQDFDRALLAPIADLANADRLRALQHPAV